MIDFGNSWTSSDAGESDRHPAKMIYNYVRDNPMTVEQWKNIPVSVVAIDDTLYERGISTSDLGSAFQQVLSEFRD